MISVCIATHNGERYISQQLISILNQLSENDEIIISDDGSTDSTLDIIKSFNDERINICYCQPIKPKRLSINHYIVTRNFENALKNATGDYIFLADQDDIWKNDKVEKVLPYLKKDFVVQSNYSIIDGNNKLLEFLHFSKSPISKRIVSNLIHQPFHGCCMAFPSKLLRLALPFPGNLIMHDNWLGLLAQLSNFKIAYLEEPLVLYRRHDNNVSKLKSKNPLWFKIGYRFSLLIALLKRNYLNKKSCRFLS